MEIGVSQGITYIMSMVFIAILLYLLVQIIIKCSQYIEAKLQEMKKAAEAAGNTAQAAGFNFAITILNGVTNTVVSSIEAQKAYNIRQAVKAGEAKVEDLNILSTEAYHEIVNLLDEQVKKTLDECVADSETFIRDKIEELLPKVKADYRKTLQDTQSVEVTENAEQAEG